MTGHDRGPSTRIFRGATVPQLIVLSCKLILHFIHIQDTKGRCPPFFAFQMNMKYMIFFNTLARFGGFFQRFDPLLMFRPFLIPKDESLLRKNIETFSSLVFCDLKNTNHTYLRLFKYLLTMGIEYYRNHTSIRPCSHTLTCDLPKVP